MIKKTLRWVGYVVAGGVAVLLYFAYPQVQTIVLFVAGGAFAAKFIEISTEAAIQKFFREDFMNIRGQIAATAENAEATERKVSMLLRDALERRQRRE